MKIYVIIESAYYDEEKMTIATTSLSDAFIASEKIPKEYYATLYVWEEGKLVHTVYGVKDVVNYLCLCNHSPVAVVDKVCGQCIYTVEECPQAISKGGGVVPSCNVFGVNAFFVADSAEFDADGFCELTTPTNIYAGCQPNQLTPTDLCTQLLIYAAFSSEYFSNRNISHILDTARMFFGNDIVENAKNLVLQYNAQPDSIKY